MADIYFRLAVAIGLGLLVGLQRERATELAGLRTFALITMMGFLAGLLAATMGGWVVMGGLIALAALMVGGNLMMGERHGPDPGITTETAALAMFATGAYLAVGEASLAVVVGASIAILLAFKGEIHGVAERLTEDDIKGIMQFALLSLVILPVLPDRTFGPYMVLNPRQIWWMVVLIVGVGLAGYIAGKFIPERTSIPLNGLLGGLVSSTATTASYGKKTREGSATPALAAAVITIASAVSLIRVLIEVSVVAPGLVRAAAGPLVTMAVVLLVLARLTYRESEMQSSGRSLKNPSQVRGALAFAFVYALVLLVSAAVKDQLGQEALYPVALVSGLTDVDAITLTASRLFATGNIDLAHAWRLILTAALANLAAKAGFVAFLGGRRLLSRIAISFAVCAAAGLAFFFLS